MFGIHEDILEAISLYLIMTVPALFLIAGFTGSEVVYSMDNIFRIRNLPK